MSDKYLLEIKPKKQIFVLMFYTMEKCTKKINF